MSKNGEGEAAHKRRTDQRSCIRFHCVKFESMSRVSSDRIHILPRNTSANAKFAPASHFQKRRSRQRTRGKPGILVLLIFTFHRLSSRLALCPEALPFVLPPPSLSSPSTASPPQQGQTPQLCYRNATWLISNLASPLF